FGSCVVTTIDNSDEAERIRRRDYVKKIRAENDAAPRASQLEMLNFRRRQAERAEQGISEPEYDDFAGLAPSDMSELQRLGLLDQAKRAAAGETKASGDGLVYKTHAPVRALLSDDPQPATDAVDHAPFDFYAWLDARLTQEREF